MQLIFFFIPDMSSSWLTDIKVVKWLAHQSHTEGVRKFDSILEEAPLNPWTQLNKW